MKKTWIPVVALTAIFLTGCGEPLHEMTDQEHELVVQYAAKTLSKYNIYQKDGVCAVNKALLEDEKQKDTPPEDTEDTKDTETSTEGLDAEVTDTQEGDDKNTQSFPVATLEQALGLTGIQTSFKEPYLDDMFLKEGVYAIDAAEGKTFYVMKIALSNNTAESIPIDVLSKDGRFRVEIGKSKVTATTTLLPEDLANYQGTIAAGETVETVLLFEIDKSVAENLSGVQLFYTQGDATYYIQCEK